MIQDALADISRWKGWDGGGGGVGGVRLMIYS
jgi:hypothetical protein